MKIIRRIKNINSGKIWMIPIENFLAESEYKDCSFLFKEKGYKVINDLFSFYKNNGLQELIMDFDISLDKKDGLLLYVNNEFERLDKLLKFRKIFFWSAIGIILLLIPFIRTDSYGKYDHSVDLYEKISRYILPIKLILFVFYTCLSFILYKSKPKLLTINIFIVLTVLISIIQILSISAIFVSNIILQEINTSISPTIGLFFSFIINLLIIFELTKSKKIIRMESREEIDLKY